MLGREAELGRIAAFLDHPRRSLALWLEGVAGIGKTTLWRAGTDLARERGWCVLSCQPSESETAYSFAALGDLLSPVADVVLPKLPAPRRAALGAALALAEGEASSGDERIVGLALLSSLRLLAECERVLVAVDDVQWLDPASSAALRFALRRVEEEQVNLLLAVRLERGAGPLGIEHELGDRLSRIPVGPLSPSDLHHLLVARFGHSLPRHTLLRVHEASAGNPLHALEITRVVLEGGAAAGPGDSIPVPPTIEDLMIERISQLPGQTRGALEVVALLSEPTLEALRGDEPEQLDQAIAAGVIELRDDRIRFTHPLLAAAVVSTIGPRRRRRLHARLARLELDVEERARHFALATLGRDAATADALEAAAHHAAQRGAPASAAELADLAAQRTPRENAEERWRRGIEAGRCYAASGDFMHARTLLEPLGDEIPPGHLRARVFLNLADIRWDDLHAQTSLAERALAEIGDDDASRTRIHLLLASLVMLDPSRAVRHLRAALDAAERAGDEERAAVALTSLLDEEIAAGELTPGLLERALALADSSDWRMPSRVPDFESPGTSLGWALIRLNRFDLARAVLEHARADALAQGAYPAAGFTLGALTELTCRLGDWRSAAAYAAELSELSEQLGLEDRSPVALYAGALVDAHLGKVDEARKAAARGLSLADRAGQDVYKVVNQGVLGFIELSLGNPNAAAGHLRPAVRRLGREGWREPLGDLKPNAIETLILVGELSEAERLLVDLEDWSRGLDAFATKAACARCRGLLHAAERDDEGARAAFAEALETYERLPMPFDQARTLLALGTLQRRTKQKRIGRESLTAALVAFEELGARLWAEKARAEIAQLGGRRAQDGRLTPTEQRVAALVAQGRTNRQVADALFISPKTVEWNLSKIYRKLYVRSRAELAAKLGRQTRA